MMSTAPVNPIRSPSYPNTSLPDAIAGVRKIEAQYRQSQVDRLVAAKILGYSGLSGPANKALAALAQFGLVERAGKGEMRVTQRARAILHPDSDAEKKAELRAAALEPSLFRILQERWPNMIPPEDGVVMFLNRQGFNQSAIRPAAKAYLQTLLFLEEAGASESHGGEPMDAPESPGLEKNPEIKVHSTTHALASQTISRPHAEAIADALMGPTLNKINMNIQGDRVHINALLDSKGLAELETKIAALKILLAVHYAANDTGVQESGESANYDL